MRQRLGGLQFEASRANSSQDPISKSLHKTGLVEFKPQYNKERKIGERERERERGKEREREKKEGEREEGRKERRKEGKEEKKKEGKRERKEGRKEGRNTSQAVQALWRSSRAAYQTAQYLAVKKKDNTHYAHKSVLCTGIFRSSCLSPIQLHWVFLKVGAGAS
jgi:hypothetical protein